MGYKSDTYQTRVCGHHPETCTCRDLDVKKEPKQETLEEVAERLANTTDEFNMFIAGAKWQQERMYSEEEVIELLNKREDCINQTSSILDYTSTKEWFEKFIKK
jgi:hypothetical protein